MSNYTNCECIISSRFIVWCSCSFLFADFDYMSFVVCGICFGYLGLFLYTFKFTFHFPLFCLFCFAEAPAKHVVELAQAAVSENENSSKEVRELSRVRLEDAETGVHEVFRKYNLACTVQVDKVDLSDDLKGFPYIKFSSWLEYLTTSRIARQLCGVSSLQRLKRVLHEFWIRYESIYPNHAVFRRARAGALDLDFTIPYFSHSDEGRSYKKEALWIFSVHGCFGRGTQHYIRSGKHKAPLRRNQFGLNFVGHSLSTQFLFATMLRETSNLNPGALQNLLKIFAEDAAQLSTQGFLTHDGRRLWAVHLGTKGDLPALGKVGNFVRSFSHVPRAPSSRKPCEGICHRCLAGQEENQRVGKAHYPFEDLSRSPAWITTIDTVEPYQQRPEILEGALLDGDQPWNFFHFDLWHIFHLGIAKHYLASCFVLIVESTLPVIAGCRSVETKFSVITDLYQRYCRSKKLNMWLKEINRDSLTWPMSSKCPVGKWNKGSASSTIMLFLGWFCENHIKGHTDDEKLILIVARLLFLEQLLDLLFFFVVFFQCSILHGRV